MNSNVMILAFAGFRSTIEAGCKHKGIKRGSLFKKINALAAKGYITLDQAESFHETRFLGNSALHEMQRPTDDELSICLEIVERMIQTLYLLPIATETLKQKRDKRRQNTSDQEHQS